MTILEGKLLRYDWYSDIARLKWTRVQRFAKVPSSPLQGSSVCSVNKQSPYSVNFCVGLLGLSFVIQAKVNISRNFRRNQLLQTCVGLFTIEENLFFFLIKRMVKMVYFKIVYFIFLPKFITIVCQPSWSCLRIIYIRKLTKLRCNHLWPTCISV